MGAFVGRPPSIAAWDGTWYLAIARLGYYETWVRMVGVGGLYGSYAFFPGFPLLVRAVSVVGLSPSITAALILLVSGIVAAYGLARLAAVLGCSHRGQLMVVALTGAAPAAVVFQIAYPDGLQIGLAAWTLSWALEHRWANAAVGALAAGLLKPTAAALILVVVVAGLTSWRTTGQRAALWVLVSPLGLLGYISYVAAQTGRVDGYLWIQARGWGHRTDGGLGLMRFLPSALADIRLGVWGPVIVGGLAVVILGLVVTRQALPVEVWAYCALVSFMTVVSSGVMTAKPRQLLIGAVVLLIPLSRWLDQRPPRVLALSLVTWLVVGAYLSAYSLTVLRGAI